MNTEQHAIQIRPDFLVHGFQVLKDAGVMAIILLRGGLSRSGGEERIRTRLLRTSGDQMDDCDTGSAFLFLFETGFDLGFQVDVESFIGFEDILGCVAALGELGAVVGEPGATLLDEVHLQGQVEE